MLLHAPRIDFAAPGDSLRAQDSVQPSPADLACTDWPSNVVWNPQVLRAFARTALQIDARRAWHGDIVCLADLALGEHCYASGSLKARGDLHVGPGCHIRGNVVAGGSIHLGANCVVLGSVLSETEVVLGSGCTVGAPDTLATVSAPHIGIAPGTTVYGTIWAEEKGHTTLPANAEANLRLGGDLSSPSGVLA